MLIDFSRKFLFIKTNKTAGTSIEIALSKVMAPADSIITPITAEDESMRTSVGGKGPCGYQSVGLCQEARETLRRSRRASFPELYNHISYREVVEFLGAPVIKSLWSFGFTRHPYDRALSIYTYRHRHVSGFSMLPLAIHQKNFEMMLQGGTVLSTSCILGAQAPEQVDRVFLYENLGEAVQEICAALAIDPSPSKG